MRFTLLLLLPLLCWVLAEKVETITRLPGNVVPSYYRLDLVTQLQGNFSFHGKVWIDFEVRQGTDRIILHSKNLTIHSSAMKLHRIFDSKWERKEERYLFVKDHEIDSDNEFLILHLLAPLKAGANYQLHLEYNGTLADNLSGFYKIPYFHNYTSELRHMAATVFEPAHARWAFPCFDEPEFKARFQINLARTENMTTLANMPVQLTEPMLETPGWVWDRYEVSPPMSTYLAAWMIGALEEREVTDERGRPIRVWARPEIVDDSQYALSVAPQLISAFENYLGVEDPLPKTDLLALPSILTEAIENWGIISISERSLLLETEENIKTKMSSASILAHELAHTWFGNLVTMKWWDSIWLNEGMATYFSSVAVQQVKPEFEYDLIAPATAFTRVFKRDKLHSSLPLTANVSKTTELRQIFNTITYHKGYYMLRMLNHSLGEPTFRGGIARYVSSHLYGNVREEDLWSALTEQAAEDGVTLPRGIDIKDLMNTWTSKAGYPLVTVHRNYTTNKATITQERFIRSKKGDEKLPVVNEKSRWWIPLTYAAQSEPLLENCTSPRLWLDPAERSVQLKGLPGPDSWILFNLHAAGLYRVNYDIHNWNLLTSYLDSDQYKEIPVLNRALLLDDVMDLAKAKVIPQYILFNMTQFLKREEHRLPWMTIFGNMKYVGRMLRNTDSYSAFRKFMVSLVTPQFQELGFKAMFSEKPTRRLHRKQIVEWACWFDHEGCIESAHAFFKTWKTANGSSNPIPVEIRNVVYRTAITHGSSEDWDFLWNSFKQSTSTSEKAGMLAALGCSKNTETLRRFLSWSIQEDSGVKKQYSRAAFEAVANNPVGNSVATTFLKENIKSIKAYFGPSPFHLNKMLLALANTMNQPEQLKELRELELLHEDSLRSASRSLNETNEIVQYNIDWLQNNYAEISTWLQENSFDQ